MKLSSEQKLKLFNAHITGHYKKRGKFISRIGIIGETILTIVAGKLETMKTVTEPSIVLRNIEVGSSAETYIVPLESYNKRYYEDAGNSYLIDGHNWQVAFAKGEVHAFQYYGKSIIISAIWGEDMIVENGDYIARPVDGDQFDIYRIEKDTFKQTYQLFD
jgi:hypothetical protein